jgi:MFS family permease
VLFGIATGMNSPTLYAWTIDCSHENNRGRAMATTYIALEAGIGISSLAAGWLYGNKTENIAFVFWLSGLIAFGAFLYLQVKFKKRKS